MLQVVEHWRHRKKEGKCFKQILSPFLGVPFPWDAIELGGKDEEGCVSQSTAGMRLGWSELFPVVFSQELVCELQRSGQIPVLDMAGRGGKGSFDTPLQGTDIRLQSWLYQSLGRNLNWCKSV